MNEDDLLSKKVVEVGAKKNQFLARQVESADRDRVTGLETDEKHPDGIASWVECSKDEVVDRGTGGGDGAPSIPHTHTA